MFAKIGDAMKDVAETLRRVYRDPPARTIPVQLLARIQPPFRTLEVRAMGGLEPFSSVLGSQQLQPNTSRKEAPLALQARLMGEGTWASWASGARVAVMGVFKAQATGRLAVPPLPKKPAVGAILTEGFPRRTRRGFEAFHRPGARAIAPGLAAPPCRKGLDLLFGLPMSISGEDLRTAPRAIQMRCSMQIVKTTGENVRNLDLLGRYLIPAKGVRELRHDAESGRLRVLLGPEASASGQALLLLARRKDDRSLLTCLVEEP